MALNVNKVTLVGRLGADPEVKGNSGDMVIMKVATSETWTDKATGERKERTQWHTVVIFNEHSARFVKQYAKKGDTVYVEGQLETRVWEKEPDDRRYFTEVVVRQFGGNVQVMSRDREPGATRNETRNDPPQSRSRAQQRQDFDDDEIPF